MNIYTIAKRLAFNILDFTAYSGYSRHFRNMLLSQNFSNTKADGEDDYIKKWNQLGGGGGKIEPYSFRFFSHYMGNSPYIVPENIGRSYIERVLNPMRFRDYYKDKCMFPVICGKENCPKTYLCRINGNSILDDDFRPLTKDVDEYIKYAGERLILKPSIDSESGRKVLLFNKVNGEGYFTPDGQKLSEGFLFGYGKNFILQEAINQHADIAVFNPTSVNTLRIATYRSYKDEEPHVLASIMRVGKSGQYVDNAHSGGLFVGIDVTTGEVGKSLFDQYGNSSVEWNGLDYSKEHRFIPHWEEIKNFVNEITKKITHHRLIAFDVSVRSDGRPVLIEYNLSSFSYWLFMMTGQKPLGEYTDEIIEYCKLGLQERNIYIA